MNTRLNAAAALQRHWPEYLIEGWALGMFMVSAGLATVAIESPSLPLYAAIASADLRRLLIGLAMGATAVALIYSHWGQRSGAHMNPAVTISFLLLGKVAAWDALYYVTAQFVGGTAGVLLVRVLIGPAFAAPEINYIVTLPGAQGATAAFVAEAVISALMMFTVLSVSNSPRYARWTGVCAGLLVATFITFEAPLSGMSINPARSFASAAVAAEWRELWIYFTAPPLGMAAAAGLYSLLPRLREVGCAKLLHPLGVRCIHCGYEPARGSAEVPCTARSAGSARREV